VFTAPVLNATAEPLDLDDLESYLNESDALELDFVNLPGYGILDDVNSAQNGSFSCYERHYGYYADITKDCSTFHLCYPVQETTSQRILYQRFSFFCSDNAVFDQQNLVCVENSTTPIDCHASVKYYAISNEKLLESLRETQPDMFVDEERDDQYNSTTLDDQEAGLFNYGPQPSSVYNFSDLYR